MWKLSNWNLKSLHFQSPEYWKPGKETEKTDGKAGALNAISSKSNQNCLQTKPISPVVSKTLIRGKIKERMSE